MTNHYYSNQPDTAHEYRTFDFELKGKTFRFTTDSHVFSKATIDYGSRVLIEAFDDQELPEGPLLDVGCGYGPIGLSLAYATNRTVEMLDFMDRPLNLPKITTKQIISNRWGFITLI